MGRKDSYKNKAYLAVNSLYAVIGRGQRAGKNCAEIEVEILTLYKFSSYRQKFLFLFKKSQIGGTQFI